jgi:hypothetical protein
MVTNFALCTIILLSNTGARDVRSVRGKILSDEKSYWVVDFTDEFKKLKIEPYVQKVKDDTCLYVK